MPTHYRRARIEHGKTGGYVPDAEAIAAAARRAALHAYNDDLSAYEAGAVRAADMVERMLTHGGSGDIALHLIAICHHVPGPIQTAVVCQVAGRNRGRVQAAELATAVFLLTLALAPAHAGSVFVQRVAPQGTREVYGWDLLEGEAVPYAAPEVRERCDPTAWPLWHTSAVFYRQAFEVG